MCMFDGIEGTSAPFLEGKINLGLKQLKGNENVLSSRETLHDYSHLNICCLFGVQQAWCEGISESISFPHRAIQNAVQAF